MKTLIKKVVLLLLCSSILVGCSTSKNEIISAKDISEEMLSQQIKEGPVFCKICYQTPERLVLYGGRSTIATFQPDVKKENYVLEKAIDLSDQEIYLSEHDFVAYACFRDTDVLLSPSHEGIDPTDEPIYHYEYGSDQLTKLGAAIPGGLKGLSASGAFRSINSGAAFEQISQKLTEEKYVLLEFGPLQFTERAYGTRFANMEYGFLMVDETGALLYGLSDQKGEGISIFPLALK